MLNIPSEKYVKEADYFGIASGKNVDKFQATGLTPVKSYYGIGQKLGDAFSIGKKIG
jgi:flavin reductase (DIM6/NTAB) family NADH-FMN oxidoreductase RutF